MLLPLILLATMSGSSAIMNVSDLVANRRELSTQSCTELNNFKAASVGGGSKECDYAGCSGNEYWGCAGNPGKCTYGNADSACQGQTNGHIPSGGGWCWAGRRDQHCPPKSGATTTVQSNAAPSQPKPSQNTGSCTELNNFKAASVGGGSKECDYAGCSGNEYWGCGDHGGVGKCTYGNADSACQGQANGHHPSGGGWCWDGRRDNLCTPVQSPPPPPPLPPPPDYTVLTVAIVGGVSVTIILCVCFVVAIVVIRRRKHGVHPAQPRGVQQSAIRSTNM